MLEVEITMDENPEQSQSVESHSTENQASKPNGDQDRAQLQWHSRIELGLNWQFSLLLIVLLFFTVIIPLGDVVSIGGLDVIFSVVILMAVLVAGRHRRWVLIGLVLVFPPVLLATIKGLDESTPLTVYNIYFLLLSLFIVIAIVSILQDVVKGHHITVHSISGVISVYILIAIVWTIGYSLVELNWPGSFDTPISSSWPVSTDSTTAVFATLFFYSIVTITTAGYGDVTAISPYARSLTSLELVVGQVFLAVLVAWLVGMYIADSINAKNSES